MSHHESGALSPETKAAKQEMAGWRPEIRTERMSAESESEHELPCVCCHVAHVHPQPPTEKNLHTSQNHVSHSLPVSM